MTFANICLVLNWLALTFLVINYTVKYFKNKKAITKEKSKELKLKVRN